jgi:hypothetical protein
MLDDDRHEKSQRHREAAFQRWESRGQRLQRRGRERSLDALRTALQSIRQLLTVSWRPLRDSSGLELGTLWRRDD